MGCGQGKAVEGAREVDEQQQRRKVDQGGTKECQECQECQECKCVDLKKEIAALKKEIAALKAAATRTECGVVEHKLQLKKAREDGSLAHLAMITSSGDQEFDRLVIESIKQAAPFPPIPKHLGIKRYKPVGGTYRVTW